MCGAQAISGTGSLRLGMQFLRKFYASEVVYVSKPTWGKHDVISNPNTYFEAFYDYFKMGCYRHTCIFPLLKAFSLKTYMCFISVVCLLWFSPNLDLVLQLIKV